MKKPNNTTVTILCITYNHEEYIAQAIESFLMQKTNFSFEIIIHDDASTDKTKDIIREYAEKHPDIIKPIYEKTNQFSKGRDQFIRDMLIVAKGQYVAECEGDDFWTDPQKLQLQVDFLEKNKEHALCFHPVRVFFEKGKSEEYIFPDPKKKGPFNINNLLAVNFIQSNSVMYRKQDYSDFKTGFTPMDWYTHLFHAQFGKIGFIDRVMSAYRRHPGGLWWYAHQNRDVFWKKYGIAHLAFYAEVLKMYDNNPAYLKIIDESIGNMLIDLLEVDKKHGYTLVRDAVAAMPEIATRVIANQHKTIQDLSQKLTDKERQVGDLNKKVEERSQIIKDRDLELHNIKSSKLWRLRDTVVKRGGKQ